MTDDVERHHNGLGTLGSRPFGPEHLFHSIMFFLCVFVKQVPSFGSTPSCTLIQNSSFRERRVDRSNKPQPQYFIGPRRLKKHFYYKSRLFRKFSLHSLKLQFFKQTASLLRTRLSLENMDCFAQWGFFPRVELLL